MLCDVCVGVIQHRRGIRVATTELNGNTKHHHKNFEDILENLVGFVSNHHWTYSTLTDSVSRGCRICRAFWEGLYESQRESIRNHDLDTTAENEGLTEMMIGCTTDCDYEITICVWELREYSYAYTLRPGQCLSQFVRTEFD
jgi:hypothetical protein